jgi:hypothetical protein
MPQPVIDASVPLGPRAAAGSRHPISIGEPEKTAIRAAVENARRLADRNAGGEHPNPTQVRLPMGYRAAISFERHASGLYRHLWIYMDAPGRLPTMPSIRLIAQEFAFDLDAPVERHTWVEQLAPGHHAANILEMQARAPRPPT